MPVKSQAPCQVETESEKGGQSENEGSQQALQSIGIRQVASARLGGGPPGLGKILDADIAGIAGQNDRFDRLGHLDGPAHVGILDVALGDDQGNLLPDQCKRRLITAIGVAVDPVVPGPDGQA